MPRKKATPPEEASAAVVDDAEALELEERNKELQDVAENVEVTEPGETVEESYSDSDESTENNEITKQEENEESFSDDDYDFDEPIEVIHLDGESPTEYDSTENDNNLVIEDDYETEESAEDLEKEGVISNQASNAQIESEDDDSVQSPANPNKRQSFQYTERQRFLRIQSIIRDQLRTLNKLKNRVTILSGTVVKAIDISKSRNKKIVELLQSSGIDTVFAKISVPGYDDNNFEFLIPFSFLDAKISGLSLQTQDFSPNERTRESRRIRNSNEIATISFDDTANNEAKIDYINSILNAQIKFTIDSILANTTIVIANRKLANYLRRRRYFYSGEKRGFLLSNTTKKYIAKDTITDANVLRVHANTLLIDVFGAQCILPIEEISYKILGTLHRTFYPGTTIRVKITFVELLQNKENDVVVHASAKAIYYEDPTRTALELASLGEIVLADVTTLNTMGKPAGTTKSGYNFRTSYFKVDSMKAFCRIGSLVKVRLIRKVYPDSTKINPNPPCYGEVEVLEVMNQYNNNHFLG